MLQEARTFECALGLQVLAAALEMLSFAQKKLFKEGAKWYHRETKWLYQYGERRAFTVQCTEGYSKTFGQTFTFTDPFQTMKQF